MRILSVALITAGLLVAFALACMGCGAPPAPLPDAAEVDGGREVIDMAMAPDLSACDHPGAYCCGNDHCDGAGLVCGFTAGIYYGKCEACGSSAPGPACPSIGGDCAAPPCNLGDCGQPCCAGDKCATGECMAGRGLSRCIAEQACGHKGQPCCYLSTFCTVGVCQGNGRCP